MKITYLSLFPNLIETWFSQHQGIISKALKEGKWNLESKGFREFAEPPHYHVDDHQFGTGEGMVLRPDICQKALDTVKLKESFMIHVTPWGHVFNHKWADKCAELLQEKKHLIFLCGRYNGFDERFLNKADPIHLSLGDFVLPGGELPALCMTESILRKVPGIIGNQESIIRDSFENGFLEGPSYTKPRDFEGDQVPEVLFSGDHKKIASYLTEQGIYRTAQYRPDVILEMWETLSSSQKSMVKRLWRQGNIIIK